ncbi:hypothetical protein BHAMNSH16_07075 [Brachyspira hampsonii]|uniref:Uncharacterized protein n=1 Tax=Brachyspira hampsonii TaxID=1287055 RepID=A0AAC9XK25_9SPIR|nr:hypothetical protein [Brachyspira hampsonii]ASJ21417.1 hypothetical protein BHAMNSH16_07075 [Brachyspira hampsonii]OEJ19674.1 hypothetical protein A9496_03450 [Brachyspira hampsonii]
MKKVRNIPLILGDKKFSNIEDLKNDFNVNDILSSYKNGNLKIWLSHKYNDLAQELKKIDESESPKKIIEDIIRIFFKDDENLEAIVKDACFIVENTVDIKNKNIESELEDYINQYNSINDSLFSFEIAIDDYENIKNAVGILYYGNNGLFNYYYEDFFYKFYNKKNYYVILSILANEDIRRIFLQNEKIKSDIDKMFTHKKEHKYNFKQFKENLNRYGFPLYLTVTPAFSFFNNNIDKVHNESKYELIRDCCQFVNNNFAKEVDNYIFDLLGDDIELIKADDYARCINNNIINNKDMFKDIHSDIKTVIINNFGVDDIDTLQNKIISTLEKYIKDTVKYIGEYLGEKTGIKHLFDFYEFRIFEVEISNFYWLKNIKIYKEYTEDNFKTVTDKKCLILHLDKNAVIKSLDNDKEYDIDSVNGYFPIFNGINYKGNKHYNELVYMEI